MPLRRFFIVLLTISLFSMLPVGRISAADQYGWVHGRYRGPLPYYVGNPKSVHPDQIAANGPPAYVSKKGNVPGALTSPRAYPYGYFGTQNRPYSVSHTNYYNDFSQWSFRRGY